MKVRFKVGRRVFAFYCFKVRRAYGVESRVKGNDGLHHLLMDFDVKDERIINLVWENLRRRFPNADIFMYETAHGFHAIVFVHLGFREAIKALVCTPYIDLQHVAIGINRGYWFLENPQCIPNAIVKRHPDLSFMAIERVEDEGFAQG
ncbi:MAG: hypothetical protein QW734_07935 [Candidatus Bathyarchaeia archaeon]